MPSPQPAPSSTCSAPPAPPNPPTPARRLRAVRQCPPGATHVLENELLLGLFDFALKENEMQNRSVCFQGNSRTITQWLRVVLV